MMDFLKFHNKLRVWTNRVYTRLVRGSFGAIGKDCQVMLPFKSGNAKDVHLGDNVIICSGAWIDCFRSYGSQKWLPKLEIGDGAYIGHRSHIMVVGEMKIGENVIIANNVYISDNMHSFENVSQAVLSQPLKHDAVTIEDEVWLGENVCVLPGVTIGRHSVIGSNSVVTGDILPYSVAVGSPARVVRRYNEELKQWEKMKENRGSHC